MLEAALDYTRQGFVVFPCLKKKPLTERGLYDASKHESQIRRWWSQNPEAQIALPTGAVNGFFALDIDNASAADFVKGLDLPQTRTVQTRPERWQLWSSQPPDVKIKNSVSELASSIDIRGDGGYVVAPPSVHHETDQPYRIVRDVPLAPAPQNLIELVAVSAPQNGNGSGISKGARHNTIFHLACKLRYEGHDEESTFNLVRAIPCDPPLTFAEIRKQVHGAFQYNGRRPAEQITARRAVVTRVSDVERSEISWLWKRRFPLGKLAILAGDGGLGKSVLSLDFAARVSCGRNWPNGDPCERGSVVILSAEDDEGDTIRPRLEAAGANIEEIHVLKAVRIERPNGDTALEYFNLSTDLPALRELVDSLSDVRLVVIDPISAYLGKTIDARKNAEVRSILHPLADLAATSRAMVLAITHLNKGVGPAVYRIMDSVAFAAAGRTAWLVTKNRENPAERLLLPGKANLGPDDASLGFTFTLKERHSAVAIEWGTAASITADSALDTEIESASDRSARTEAADWLTSLLEAGPMPVTTVQEEAKRNGFAWRTIQRAKARLPVSAHKLSMSGGWAWELGKSDAEGGCL
jgi:hypothetical protein